MDTGVVLPRKQADYICRVRCRFSLVNQLFFLAFCSCSVFCWWVAAKSAILVRCYWEGYSTHLLTYLLTSAGVVTLFLCCTNRPLNELLTMFLMGLYVYVCVLNNRMKDTAWVCRDTRDNNTVNSTSFVSIQSARISCPEYKNDGHLFLVINSKLVPWKWERDRETDRDRDREMCWFVQESAIAISC